MLPACWAWTCTSGDSDRTRCRARTMARREVRPKMQSTTGRRCSHSCTPRRIGRTRGRADSICRWERSHPSTRSPSGTGNLCCIAACRCRQGNECCTTCLRRSPCRSRTARGTSQGRPSERTTCHRRFRSRRRLPKCQPHGCTPSGLEMQWQETRARSESTPAVSARRDVPPGSSSDSVSVSPVLRRNCHPTPAQRKFLRRRFRSCGRRPGLSPPGWSSRQRARAFYTWGQTRGCACSVSMASRKTPIASFRTRGFRSMTS